MLEGFSPRAQARLLEQVGAQVTGILDTTRQMVRDEVQRGLEAGLGGGALGDALEDAAAFSEYRGELIARTETAIFLNRAATETYRDYGVTHVTVIDGDGDEECAAADGQTWTLEEADANPIAHPNCVRDFAPIVGEVPEQAAPSEEGAPGAVGRDDAAIDTYTNDFAAKYQSDPIEHGAVIDQQGNVLQEFGGIDPSLLTGVDDAGFKIAGGAVDLQDAQAGIFRDNILIHTHPGGNTPLSTGDVSNAISKQLAEIRAEAKDYSYRLRPGRDDGLWHDADIQAGSVRLDMDKFYESSLDRISSDPKWLEDIQSGALPKDFDLVEAWMSEAWQETADEFGWVYDRVLR